MCAYAFFFSELLGNLSFFLVFFLFESFYSSAGIGRAGTFTSIITLLSQLKQQYAAHLQASSAQPWTDVVSINVHEVVRRLRMGRAGMVQTPVRHCVSTPCVF